MTKEQLAELLNGRSKNHKITKAEIEAAKNAGLAFAIAYDDSDWLEHLTVRGAIGHDEILDSDAKVYLFEQKPGEYWLANEEEYGKMAAKEVPENTPFIQRIQGLVDDGFCYKLTSSMPYASFNTMVKGSVYCEGVVFSIADLPQSPSESDLIWQRMERHFREIKLPENLIEEARIAHDKYYSGRK